MSINEVVARVQSNWVLKIVFGTVLTIGFTLIYFGVLQNYQLFSVTTMPISWIDRLIPCVPATVYLYESLWLLMPIAPWLLKTKHELFCYSKAFVGMSIIGFFIFFFFPTAIPRPTEVPNTNALYEMLIRFDKGINACPSFHAVFAVFHAACCHVIFRGGNWNRQIRRIIWIWALGILASTLLTKQHVIVDIVAGAALGMGGFAVFMFSTKEAAASKKEHA